MRALLSRSSRVKAASLLAHTQLSQALEQFEMGGTPCSSLKAKECMISSHVQR